MAKIAKNLNELIGNTPLLQLSNFASNKNLEANVIVKLESFNPAGCVKERIALAMVEAAEAAGILKPGVASHLAQCLLKISFPSYNAFFL